MVTNMQFSCIVKQMKAIIPVSILAGNNRNAISSLAQEKTFFFWGGGGVLDMIFLCITGILAFSLL
jgi:hypothetical protein